MYKLAIGLLALTSSSFADGSTDYANDLETPPGTEAYGSAPGNNFYPGDAG